MRRITTSMLCLLVLGCGGPELDKELAKATATGPLTAAARKVTLAAAPAPAAMPVVEREEPRPAAPATRPPSPARARPARVAAVAPTRAPAPRVAPAAPARPAPAPARAVAVATTTPAPASVAPAPAPVAPEAPPAPSVVELSRVIVARRIEDREPVGLAPFDGDVDELFVFLDARNDGAPATLQVRWDAPDGTPGRAIDLQVPTARRWRTWATTNRVRGRAGTWTVVVTDASGREIARRSFTVDAPAAS